MPLEGGAFLTQFPSLFAPNTEGTPALLALAEPLLVRTPDAMTYTGCNRVWVSVHHFARRLQCLTPPKPPLNPRPLSDRFSGYNKEQGATSSAIPGYLQFRLMFGEMEVVGRGQTQIQIQIQIQIQVRIRILTRIHAFWTLFRREFTPLGRHLDSVSTRIRRFVDAV